MGWFFSMAFRNVFRNTRRSALTTATVVLGTALLVLASSWLEGLIGGMLENISAIVGQVRVVQPGFAKKEALNPLYENIADTGPLLSAVQEKGWRGYPVLRAPTAASIGDELGESFCMTLGAPASFYQEVMQLDQRLISGTYPKDSSEALLGSLIATELGAKPGDDLLLLGQTQDGSLSPVRVTVSGVVSAGNALSDRTAFLDLEKVRYLADIPDGSTELLVYADLDADLLARRLRELPEAEGLTVQAWTEREPYGTIGLAAGFISSVLGGSIVLIAALAVLNTMLMSVLERTAEVGVLRAMGMGSVGVVLMFLVEASSIGVAGGVIGALLGSLPAAYFAKHGLDLGSQLTTRVAVPIDTVIYTHLTPSIVGGAVILGVVMALLGALIPAVRAAAIQPVEAMRARR